MFFFFQIKNHIFRRALLQLPLNNEHAIELNTPNRNEILKDGLPKHTKYKILGKGAFGTVFKAIFRGNEEK